MQSLSCENIDNRFNRIGLILLYFKLKLHNAFTLKNLSLGIRAICREDLIEAIKLNIIDQKKYSFEALSARFYPFPYSHKKFTQCRHIFIIALLILLGLEEAI